MTLNQLVTGLLRRLFAEHYGPDKLREFARDRNALLKAIARYGHECASRGWYFEESAIFCDLNRILDTLRRNRADIRYLPVYLEGTVDRHIRLRAEELSAAARSLAPRLERIRRGLPPAVPRVIERKPVEVLDALWRSLGARRRQLARQRRAAAALTQPAWF